MKSRGKRKKNGGSSIKDKGKKKRVLEKSGGNKDYDGK